MDIAKEAAGHKERSRILMRTWKILMPVICGLGISLALIPAEVIPASPAGSQTSPAASDLTKAAAGQGWKVVNRSATMIDDGGRKAIRLDERLGDGLVWLEGVSFGDGTIEFDVRGKDDFQKSFVGAAFHGADDRTFEAVYFRPFNFKPSDPARAARAVQYVSHPEFTWQKLRAERPGRYEHAVDPVPDPNGWFHVRIVVARPKVSVFVDGSTEPCLTVETLSDRREGLVGLMVGNGSGGDFSGFKVTPAALAAALYSQELLEAVKAGYSFLDWIGPDSWLRRIVEGLGN